DSLDEIIPPDFAMDKFLTPYLYVLHKGTYSGNTFANDLEEHILTGLIVGHKDQMHICVFPGTDMSSGLITINLSNLCYDCNLSYCVHPGTYQCKGYLVKSSNSLIAELSVKPTVLSSVRTSSTYFNISEDNINGDFSPEDSADDFQYSNLSEDSDEDSEASVEIESRSPNDVARRPQVTKNKTAKDYTPSPKCKNFFKKNLLYRHYKRCGNTISRTVSKTVPRTLQAHSGATLYEGTIDCYKLKNIVSARKNKRNVREELNAQAQHEDESASSWTGAERNEVVSPLSIDGAVGQTKVDHTPQRSEKFYALPALPLGLPSAEQLRQATGAIPKRVDNNKVTSAGPITPSNCAMRHNASVGNHQTTERMHQPRMDDRAGFHPTGNGSRPVPQPMYDCQIIPQWNNSRPLWVKAKDVISEFDGTGPVHPMEIISQLEMAV
ncbi:hypothetical protein CBL_20873, partial [Carabus blaptoides fortunei]